MALTECPDCARQISNEAFTCPNCGKPTRPNDPLKVLGVTTIVLGIVGALYLTAPLERLFSDPSLSAGSATMKAIGVAAVVGMQVVILGASIIRMAQR